MEETKTTNNFSILCVCVTSGCWQEKDWEDVTHSPEAEENPTKM